MGAGLLQPLEIFRGVVQARLVGDRPVKKPLEELLAARLNRFLGVLAVRAFRSTEAVKRRKKNRCRNQHRVNLAQLFPCGRGLACLVLLDEVQAVDNEARRVRLPQRLNPSAVRLALRGHVAALEMDIDVSLSLFGNARFAAVRRRTRQLEDTSRRAVIMVKIGGMTCYSFVIPPCFCCRNPHRLRL